ncbi:MAG: hypothetical protein WA748_10920 [Candidatus Acidiferrum sp.]
MRWSVAIFSSRETVQTLSASIGAILTAANQVASTIDVIVNGNRELANEVARYIETLRPAARPPTVMRIWYISVADKAHAWNKYIYDILPASEIAFFVDGYAQVAPEALKLISDGLGATPKALAATGVPTIGRSSGLQTELMLREGGLHGSLYAVRGGFVEQLRSTGFLLPLGLYRTDGVLGAAISFALDPAKNDWDSKRILVHPKATWKIRPLSWASAADIRSHLKKIIRQAQGVLENLAVREHLAIQKKTPQSLPRTGAELVRSWIAEHPMPAIQTFLSRPLCLAAAWKLRRPRDWSEASRAAVLVSHATFE